MGEILELIEGLTQPASADSIWPAAASPHDSPRWQSSHTTFRVSMIPSAKC